MKISVVILTLNSEKYLQKCLESLIEFDEVVILDNGSDDRTLNIAEKFNNTRIEYSPFIGFGRLKKLAACLAKHDWILNIDSDEILSKELLNEIKNLELEDSNKVYEFPRINHYRGRVIKTCGWSPDLVKRLYHKGKVNFNDRQVHESLITGEGIIITALKHPILHYSFDGAEGLVKKMQQYSTLYAEEYRFRKKSSVIKAIMHGMFSFVKSYILKKGFLSKGDGFVISFANACGSYYKYVKLHEANSRLTTTLMITTYNRPDALEAVLESVLHQEELPDEVVIADDGSGEQTVNVVDKFRAVFPVPLKHAWQPDNGFRAAESRNRALKISQNEYVIMIDGDMVLHPKFIADHKKAAKKGVFIQGGRVMLTKEKTIKLLRNPSLCRPLKWYEKGLEKRLEKRLSTLHLPLISSYILRRGSRDPHRGVRSCNMAMFRDDILAINGFNNDFSGWGREDSEFVARFYNNGGKRADIKFSAIAYHLWHHEEKRDSLLQNDKILADAIEGKLIRCQNGIDQL